MVDDDAFSHEIDNAEKGHQTCIAGSGVTAILLNGLILPSASAVEGL